MSDCKAARCGDGIVQEGVEMCDDGITIDADACRADCGREVGGTSHREALLWLVVVALLTVRRRR